ncbi:MAG: hypothetical protein JOZ88_07805 [Hyphomicrobiales bacterium]|nr:hypothetical protein [Hyphomicrobiales bacterium]
MSVVARNRTSRNKNAVQVVFTGTKMLIANAITSQKSWQRSLLSLARCFGFAFSIFAVSTGAGTAADLQPVPEASPPIPEVASGWTFRVIPYAWLSGLYGSSTVKGRTVNVNLPFDKLLEKTVGKGNFPVALMGDFEARYGAFSVYSDLVWTKVDASGDRIRVRGFSPQITGAIGTAHDVTIRMGIAEAGGTYEAARFVMPHGDNPGIPVAIDLIAGARYWYQQTNVSFNLTAGLSLADLVIGSRGLAIAKSGNVDWTDPLIGARARFEIAPGQNIFVRGDVGGFGVGSKFSWQAIGGYSFDFAQSNGVTYSGLVGFRALYVDYSQGSGQARYAYKMLQIGPAIGVGFKF